MAFTPRQYACCNESGLEHEIVGRRSRGQRTLVGAGLIAFASLPLDGARVGRIVDAVLLVNKADGKLGFPKGAANPGESAVDTAWREWWEETSLPWSSTYMLSGFVLLDQWTVHYFVATWQGEVASDVPWRPVTEDFRDDDPVVQAQWVRLTDAFRSPSWKLSDERKELLTRAHKRYGDWRNSLASSRGLSECIFTEALAISAQMVHGSDSESDY